MEFNSILEHKFKDGVLIFKTRYVGDVVEAIVDISFGVLKKDEPVIVPGYIKEHVVEDKRQGHVTDIAALGKILCVREMQRIKRIRMS